MVGKVSAVITFSFVCLKVTPRGKPAPAMAGKLPAHRAWLMAASPGITGQGSEARKRAALVSKTMIL
ncbi:hypothetical protein KAM622c_15350 [Klebsiella quasipneumoniae subsp. quasipneumoniae]|nr:hypothetical protein KAM622c_15350 [Klebsiella quasipneumoniae subsp. quasipneumoniae]